MKSLFSIAPRGRSTGFAECFPPGRQIIAFLMYLGGWALAVLLVVIVPHTTLELAGGGVDAGLFYQLAAYTFMACSMIYGTLMIAMLILMAKEFFHRRALRTFIADADLPHVSILVPAFNEVATIYNALEGLIDLDYPSFEIIVVDDGSTDGTYDQALRAAERFEPGRCQVFRKENGGKWAALNFAFAQSSGTLIMCLDADSRIAVDSLRKMVERMLSDVNIAAVSGCVRIRNLDNMLLYCQAIEYCQSNTFYRVAQSATGSVLVIPGPIGLYRRSALERAAEQFGNHESTSNPAAVTGPYEHTFAEDFDLSLTVLAQGGRIVYEPWAFSNTKAPADVLTLLNQRYRWRRGSVQVILKYLKRAKTYASFRRPHVAFWLTALYLLDMAILPLTFSLYWIVVLSDLAGGGNRVLSATAVVVIYGQILYTYLLGAAVHGDSLKPLLGAIVAPIYSGLLLPWILLLSVIDELRGTKMRW